MRLTRRGRRWTTALLAAALGAAGWPGVASAAEVTITTSPAQVHQGDAIELAVLLPEERTGTRTTRIELRMPADAPIGEVYPLSVPGWAPRITTRTLDRPVAGIHSPELDQVTEAVTWIRMPGATGPARLSLGMGPMPATDRLAFQVVQTYADGTVVRWADPPGGAHPAPTVPLLPAPPDTGGHAGHDGAGAEGAAGAPAGPAPTGDTAGGPSADLLLGGGLLAGLAGGAALGWLLSRRRHGGLALPAEDSPAEVDRSPAGEAEGGEPEQDRPARGDTGEPVLTAVAALATTRRPVADAIR